MKIEYVRNVQQGTWDVGARELQHDTAVVYRFWDPGNR